MNPNLIGKLKYLPDNPGVYFFKTKVDKIIYIGKALNLSKRIKSYFKSPETVNTAMNTKELFTAVNSSAEGYHIKIENMVKQVDDIDYIITSTEEEALLLEANLIKKHRPRYNILLKDDKKYPFLKLTIKEEFPRILVSREVIQDGSKYFGPYADATTIRKTMRYIEWILPIRTCKRDIKSKALYDKPCLNYQLGKCPAPCIGQADTDEYGKTIQHIISFLNGRDKEIVEALKSEMTTASKQLNFEKAAKIRDRISTLERIGRNQTIHFPDEKNRDVISIYKEEDIAAVSVLKVLAGKVLNNELYTFDNLHQTNTGQILSAFISQYYSERLDKLPHQIYTEIEPEDYDTLNKWLGNKLIVPQKGDNRLLVKIAQKNAFHYVESIKLSHLRKTDRTVFPVQELKEKLNLSKLPRKIICIDISTAGGLDTVSSLIYFENGKPLKKNYRRFAIKTFDRQDDYAAISETLTRYFTQIKDEYIPDLIVIDGGKGQLNTAVKAINSLQINEEQLNIITGIPIISLAKKVEQVFIMNHPYPDHHAALEPIFLPRSSSSLRLLVNIRDEAHRFAITYHRLKRKKNTLTSELDNIKGIGEHTKFLLLKHFGSVKNIHNASKEELMSIKGIGEKTAALLKGLGQ